MSVERTISTSHGSSFNILDTGAPDSDPTEYLTFVFLHGYGIPSIGKRYKLIKLLVLLRTSLKVSPSVSLVWPPLKACVSSRSIGAVPWIFTL